jgi:hypothetical protein
VGARKLLQLRGGILFDKREPALIQCPDELAGSYTIPDNITTIGDEAVVICIGLTSVMTPGSLTSIGGCASYECISLIGAYFRGSALFWCLKGQYMVNIVQDRVGVARRSAQRFIVGSRSW